MTPAEVSTQGREVRGQAKARPDASLQVKALKLVALFLAAVAADGRDIEHAVPELDEGAALDGDVQVSDVVQDEVDQLLELVLPQVLLQALDGQHLQESPDLLSEVGSLRSLMAVRRLTMQHEIPCILDPSLSFPRILFKLHSVSTCMHRVVHCTSM